MFCASPPPVSPCYGELSPCYGEIISLLLSCSACTVHRQFLPNLLLFKLIFLQKPVLRPPILPVFRLLSGSIRQNQGAKPPLDDPAEFASPQLEWSPGDLRWVNAVVSNRRAGQVDAGAGSRFFLRAADGERPVQRLKA